MNVAIKPLVLRTLRENRGIPIDAMANKLKMSAEAYKKYEAQETSLTIERAEKIAKIFHRNWTVFLLNSPPEKPKFNHDTRTGKLQSSGIGLKTYDALEEANYLLNFVVSISEDQDNRIPNLPTNISATALAYEFRKAINKPSDKDPEFESSSKALNFWIKELGEMGINVSRFPLGEDDGVRAFSIHKKNRAIIVLNSGDTDNGKIFSLFHEVAHILRRNTGVCDLHRDGDEESYCNAFASEILIPTSKYTQLIKELEVNDDTALDLATKVAKALRVSRLSILTRFLKSNLISNPKYDALYASELEFYKEYKEKQKIARDIARENAKSKGKKIIISPYPLKRARLGRLFTNEILNAMHTSKVSPFQASKYIGFSIGSIGSFNEWVGKNEGS